MSHSIFNRRWAGIILEALTRHGVRHVCIAPGSRSAPLTLAAAANQKLHCHTHFDERGLGHFALGLAKAVRQPIAIIVTSGTAVANLYPAVIEAGLTGERLIILSADRPPELIDCGANQAISQPGIFAGQTAGALNLPRPTPELPARWLLSAIDSLLGEHPHGAVHVNCPFAEPLYGGDPAAFRAWDDDAGSWWQSAQPWLSTISSQAVPVEPQWPRLREKRGLIVVGKVSAEEGAALANWARELGWPLLADVQSQTGQPLPCAELWLREPQAIEALASVEFIIQFGSHLTGKRLTGLLTLLQPERFWLIEAMPGRRDPAHHRACRMVTAILPWLAQHPAVPQAPWHGTLRSLASDAQQKLGQRSGDFGEAQLAHRLPALLPEGGALFLGNSLTIRLVNALAQLPAGYPVYANRGASGIDGLIATAAGVQRGRDKPLLAIVGDLSALYDLNSLALLREQPVALIVVNNNGGQIFSMLPTPEAERARFFSLPQQADFSCAAGLFGLRYAQPQSWYALADAVKEAWQQGATLIELRVDDEAGARFLADAANGR
ncbi:2-succinyl-5-enolpyruvyl-6-hydroxy-3-cyclohexene-1-carboxylic-acid synthase [Erwinia oleae]|uniref:2-succinyl-5-enolpyruvyl-6-hydroxy-3- cyclohexene-1-carboxylic-acid synthase n=1 Tax=Erwinia oleae TaxID=796334 RepID=UPI0005581E67|nr:2-succinyl-5-enolpyruvyl-6-hydroxy-3-cyclohexene-1-carboxylic-acid synthase [Erwinia oleae]